MVGTTVILYFVPDAASVAMSIYLISQSFNLSTHSTLFDAFQLALNCTTQISSSQGD